MTSPRPHRTAVSPSRMRSRAGWLVGGVLLSFAATGISQAYWGSTDSSNFAAAAADTLPQGATPTLTATGDTVAVGFTRATTTGGRDVTSYAVSRYASAGASTPSATFVCPWPSGASLSCSESNVPGGTWYYADTPQIAGSLWSGGESLRTAVTVALADTTAPTVSVTSVTPTPNANGYNNSSPVTVNLSANDESDGSGVAFITYRVDGGAPSTVNASTAAVAVSGDGVHSVSYFATDNASNASSTQSHPVRIDTAAPAAPTVSAPTYVSAANVASVPVSGTAEAGASVTLTVRDAGSTHTVSQTRTADTSGAWSSALDLRTLNEGPVSYSATATDVAGNTSAAGTASSTKDTAGPAISGVVTSEAGGVTSNGRVSSGDLFSVTFGEALNPGSIPTGTQTLTIVRPGNGAGTATISGVLSTPFATSGYVNGKTSVSWSGSLSLSADNRTVTFTVTSAGSPAPGSCTAGNGGSCTFPYNAGEATTSTLTPNTSIADAAGNAATGSFTPTPNRLFW